MLSTCATLSGWAPPTAWAALLPQAPEGVWRALELLVYGWKSPEATPEGLAWARKLLKGGQTLIDMGNHRIALKGGFIPPGTVLKVSPGLQDVRYQEQNATEIALWHITEAQHPGLLPFLGTILAFEPGPRPFWLLMPEYSIEDPSPAAEARAAQYLMAFQQVHLNFSGDYSGDNTGLDARGNLVLFDYEWAHAPEGSHWCSIPGVKCTPWRKWIEDANRCATRSFWSRSFPGIPAPPPIPSVET